MLYANTDDGSSALWVCDGNGIVVDNVSIYGAERAPILEQINEHYGTSFTGWSDNEMGLRFGDHVPNWNAYEKIELPEPQGQKIAVKMDIRYIAGTLLNGVYLCLATSSNSWAGISNDGVVAGTYPKVSDVAIDLKSKLSAAGYTNVNVQMNETFVASGDVLSDWSDYEKIG